MEHLDQLSAMKARLAGVSPSFCLAKWLQVTLHLQNGFNHSCHHPVKHLASLEAIAKDPSALHNTEFKKQMRRMMIEGKRPPECEFCWRVEDTALSEFSDRVVKSADPWAEPRFAEVAAMDPSENINPSYLEVSFGNECNFRCSYCAPGVSSAVWASYEKHGPYVGRNSLDELRKKGETPLKTEDNPYVKAFWDWFPSLAPDLKVFRITGGEPLVNPNTFRVLDYLENNPLPNLLICINSNLGVPERLFQKFIEKLKALTANGKIRNFFLYTSVDTHGDQAEYLRVGLDYKLWLNRVRTYLRETGWPVTVMVTFNALSVPSFPSLLRDLMDLNREFPGVELKEEKKRVWLDIAHLTQPEYFSAWILNEHWLNEIPKLLSFMNAHVWQSDAPSGFNLYEIHKMARVVSWTLGESKMRAAEAPHFQALFAIFAKQCEEREGKPFLAIFPEMADFMQRCERALQNRDHAFYRRHWPRALIVGATFLKF